jgi:hypothetical protein
VTDADRPESSFVQNVTAVDGFAYGVIGADLHVFPDRGPVYLLAEHRPAQEPDAEWLLAQPSRMLNARYAVVDFTGRQTELAELTRWLDTRSRLAARWLHAPGGQGKTRLVAELASQVASQGWKVAVATHGPGAAHSPPGSQDLRLGDAAGLLLLVDYADRWPLTHLTWLFSNALFHQRVPTRLLLLARAAQPWRALHSTLEDHQADVSDQLILPLPAGDKPGERAEMFAVARRNFAARYGITDPAVITRITPPGPLEPADFGLTLAVHTAALVAVDAHVHGVRPPADLVGLTAYLLDRERRGWTRLYENRLEGLDFHTPPSVMARTVFTATLTGPASHRKGREILTRLDMEGHPDRLLTDHAICYPPTTAGSVLEPFYPDRLAEDFLALSLPGLTLTAYPADPWSATAIANLVSRDDEGTPPSYIARTLTFLAAAAAPGRWVHVSQYLNTILRADPALAIAAGGAALTALAEALDVDVLEGVATHLPSGTHVDLDPAAAVITVRLLPHWLARAGDNDETRAFVYGILSHRLGNTNRLEEALAAAEQTVEIRRRLAADQPNVFEPDLARSLTYLGLMLAKLGRLEESLAAAEEAAGNFRRLAAVWPQAFESGLATSLSSLGSMLSVLGRREEALAAAEEATGIFRRLAADRPDDFEPALSESLKSLGRTLSKLERREEALAAIAEAAGIYRRLAAARPEAFQPDLAASLSSLSVTLKNLGRREEALAAAEEATGIYRRLAADRPDDFEPDLATALSSLSSGLSGLGRRDDALAAIAEAAEIRRRLAAARPEAFEPELAGTLSDLAFVRSELGHRAEALAAAAESAEIYRRLAAARPEAFEPELARTLSYLGIMLSGMGRPEEALAAAAEGAGIYRRLAAARPQAFEPELAGTLSVLCVRLSVLGRRDEALAAAAEAAGIHRRLAAARPEAFEPFLAGSLSNLAMMLSGLGRPAEALAATAESVETFRRLAAARPEAFEPDLATALHNLGMMLQGAGRREEALAAAEKGTETYRRLAAARPEAFEPYLAESLTTLGIMLSELRRRDDALTATAEAAEILRRLAAARPEAFEPDLARSLHQLSVRLSRLGRQDEALAAAVETAEIYRRLAAARPEAFEPHLATALHDLGMMLSELGRQDEALAAVTEAAEVRRRLAADRPDDFEPDLATTLHNLGTMLSELGRQDEALAAATETAGIFRRLAADRPDDFEPDLATALHDLGMMLSELGRRDEALAAAAEAAGICRRLAADRPDDFEPDLATALHNLGTILSELGRRDEALAAAAEATEIRRRLAAARPDAFEPDLARSLFHLGRALSALGRRDDAGASVAEAVEIYRQLTDSAKEPIAAGRLAQALRGIDPVAAEQQIRTLLDTALTRGDYLGASSAAGMLVNYLMAAGRLAEALTLADENIGYIRQAEQGPWDQLSAQVRRLQVLVAMGEGQRVLDDFHRLRAHMDTLLANSQQPKEDDGWEVREVLLNTGFQAAAHLGRWQYALDLNAEIAASQAARGAPASQVAQTRFNDYLPLIRINRLDEALAVLLACRQAFQEVGDIQNLGRVLTALADLESERGNGDAAISLQKEALRYNYCTPNPGTIAVSHHNLGTLLGSHARQEQVALAHHLAAALLRAISGSSWNSSYLKDSIFNAVGDLQALSEEAAMPEDVAELCDQVSAVPGVDLAHLVTRLSPQPGVADKAYQELAARVRVLAAAPSPALSRYLAGWDPIIAALLTARAGNIQAAATLDYEMAEGSDFPYWAPLAAALSRIRGGDTSPGLLQGLDTVQAAIAARALDAIAGNAAIPPELWLAIPLRRLISDLVAAAEGDSTAAARARQDLAAANPETDPLAAVLERILGGDHGPALPTELTDPTEKAIVATILHHITTYQPDTPWPSADGSKR